VNDAERSFVITGDGDQLMVRATRRRKQGEPQVAVVHRVAITVFPGHFDFFGIPTLIDTKDDPGGAM